MIRAVQADRVRVDRVRILRNGNAHEIPNCWIGVLTDTAEVRVWLTAEDAAPLVTVPLDEVIIEWPELQVPM